ncbi:MAG: hypothetical protein ACKO0M_04235 [Cyanobium sp.]
MTQRPCLRACSGLRGSEKVDVEMEMEMEMEMDVEVELAAEAAAPHHPALAHLWNPLAVRVKRQRPRGCRSEVVAGGNGVL